MVASAVIGFVVSFPLAFVVLVVRGVMATRRGDSK